MQKSPFVAARWFMLGTDWIIRAKCPKIEGGFHSVMDSAPHLHEPAEGTFRVRTACVEQYSVTDTGDRVDSLTDRAGWISASQCN